MEPIPLLLDFRILRGTKMAADIRDAEAPAPDNNIVLRQLEGMRREMRVMLERQDRTQELVQRSIVAIGELRSDTILIENNLLSRHNEILDILRRLGDS